jgi:hypothetical protein
MRAKPNRDEFPHRLEPPESALFGIAILSRDDSRLTHDNRKVRNSNRFGEHVQEEIEAVSQLRVPDRYALSPCRSMPTLARWRTRL